MYCMMCSSENVDYDDFHPQSLPLQAENPSSEYKAVMKNLCDGWQSPISYLKKRGYMPNDIEFESKVNSKKETHSKSSNISPGENYFFFPDNKQETLRSSLTQMENEDNEPNKKDILKYETTSTELPPTEIANNDTIGIINKVKNKFLSIFSHKDKNINYQSNENIDLDEPEFLESLSDRRLFERSVPEKPANTSISSNDGLLSNLTATEIHFIKSFISWFKQNKDDFKFLTPSNSSISGKNSQNSEVIASTLKPEVIRPNGTKPNVQNTTDKKIQSTTIKSINTTAECNGDGGGPSKTLNTTQDQTNGLPTKANSTTTNGKDVSSDFTVDLDINQKNGTGEEIYQKPNCPCIQNLSSTPRSPCSDKNKYITKSKFLAHLHHMVDEVGKPPHKPLDLAKVQDVIDKSKKLPTVIMGGDKTTQCAPLRLNDMSFDLEWSKINPVSPSGQENINILDLPYDNQPQGQSLASKFLQDFNSYPEKSDQYLKTPYADNFLDSQQTLPNSLDLPLKSSTKRETVLPSFGEKEDMYAFPESESDLDETPKRRVKARIKGRGRKKPKHKHNTPKETIDIDENLDDLQNTNDFNSFDELKDIQFRVNENDEEAISKFISNLNSPPEIFSFDVDKYLTSAKQNMEPKTAELEYQSPEQRTYYEFLESPAVENEQLPLIEAPSQPQSQPVIDKRSRTSPEKRDLLRQYIKGVSSALRHNYEGFCEDCNKSPEEKLQRSPNLDTNIEFRTNNLIDGFSTNLAAMDSIKSKESDDSMNNYYLLNDGSDQDLFDAPKQDPDVIPNDYSPQSLEIDLDLDKKFRDLNIGGYTNGLQRSSVPVDSQNVDEVQDENNEIERSNIDATNNDIY